MKSTTFHMVRPLNSQLTYVKKLDTPTVINAMAIANLSSIVKDIVIQSHNKFQQISQDMSWLNVTLRNYSELYRCPRRNVPDFGRVFLMLKYTDVTQNTYVQS